MERIEEITGETCMMKVYALRISYVDDLHEHCRTCKDDYLQPYYKPMKNSQIPFRQGRLAR